VPRTRKAQTVVRPSVRGQPLSATIHRRLSNAVLMEVVVEWDGWPHAVGNQGEAWECFDGDAMAKHPSNSSSTELIQQREGVRPRRPRC
jgi:hypothetical protein